MNRQDYKYRVVFISDNRDKLSQNMKQFIKGIYNQLEVLTNLEAVGEHKFINEELRNITAYKWVTGKHINWSEEQRKYGKIPLPGYSFEKIHCWVDKTKNFDDINMALKL